MTRPTIKVELYIQMETVMKGIGKTIGLMVMESIITGMEECTRVNGRMISRME